MELGLSLGDASTAVGFLSKGKSNDRKMSGLDFCMTLGLARSPAADEELNLVPELDPHRRIQSLLVDRMGFGTLCSSGNKRLSKAGNNNEEEEDNGMNDARKKLRLSKQQSSFLEESFKEHNTLNHKQKLALAKQLNLRHRQVEVWFQNRRARMKLKQTEVDCDYLKRCCETLTKENRRLQKELQELRALKTTNNCNIHLQLPATTLTMCPACRRVATTSVAVVDSVPFPLTRARYYSSRK